MRRGGGGEETPRPPPRPPLAKRSAGRMWGLGDCRAFSAASTAARPRKAGPAPAGAAGESSGAEGVERGAAGCGGAEGCRPRWLNSRRPEETPFISFAPPGLISRAWPHFTPAPSRFPAQRQKLLCLPAFSTPFICATDKSCVAPFYAGPVGFPRRRDKSCVAPFFNAGNGPFPRRWDRPGRKAALPAGLLPHWPDQGRDDGGEEGPPPSQGLKGACRRSTHPEMRLDQRPGRRR